MNYLRILGVVLCTLQAVSAQDEIVFQTVNNAREGGIGVQVDIELLKDSQALPDIARMQELFSAIEKDAAEKARMEKVNRSFARIELARQRASNAMEYFIINVTFVQNPVILNYIYLVDGSFVGRVKSVSN